jgi:hypothetical protein
VHNSGNKQYGIPLRVLQFRHRSVSGLKLTPAGAGNRCFRLDDNQRQSAIVPRLSQNSSWKLLRTNTNQAQRGQYGGGWSVSPVNDCKPPRTR